MNREELIRYVSDGFDKAKGGEAIQVYNAVLPCFEDNTLPEKSHYPFGWIIYYALHQSADINIADRKRMLAVYLKLRLAKPHKLHSMILTEAIRLYKDAKNKAFNARNSDVTSFSILRFIQLWNLDYLREGDWRRKEYEGKTLGSTAEKLITACVDELETSHALAPDSLTAIIDKALGIFPDTPALLSQRASIHAHAGETAEAKGMLRKALILAPGKFYLWSRLAGLVSHQDNLHLHMALLYKALRAPGQDQFKGKIRADLAQAWLAKGMPRYAKWELDRVTQMYKTNGWHLSKGMLEAEKGIPADTIAENPEQLYRRIEHLADDEVYSSLPEITVTKTYHKNPDQNGPRPGAKPSAAWRVTDSGNNNYWLQPHRFGLDPNLPIGTTLLIRIHNGKAVKARLNQ